jgi:hypothetical protein
MKFNLEKETAKVKFVLEKKQMPNVRASVVDVLDVSGSAQGLFNSGAMQKAFQTILPVAINFDDNGEIDVYTFADGARNVSHIEPNATAQNYEDYLQKNVLDNRNVPKWGRTDYAPVMEQILKDFGFYRKEGFFSSPKLHATSKSGDPVIVFFKTDGSNDDQGATRKLFREMQDAGVQLYTLFIGIGPESYFHNIVSLGDEFGNVGFLSVADIEKTSERDDIYDLLLPEELLTWLKTK